ncbi:tail fiber protein [Aggregatibacter actinomycetemcomitans]|uniref:tail fiber protein n=1 Tax=Aggregatibacter actinomycetemcomitans TaxID=714 RepID=UPI00197BA536|nr:tail fiber protein [Aggregatibacter actinomycetemcomitans]
MSEKSWYKRSHQFTPYTKADGQAVSDEFDSIQASFERIPEMRDDGKGFAVSPIIPEPTEPNHPVTLRMLTETERSVNNSRDDVTAKAQQVAQNTQTVERNTQTAINQANSASQSAASALESKQSANNSENMARKWASNPEDEIVLGDKYSAYHYAMKAGRSAHNLSVAEQSARDNAKIATQKAEEAKASAKKAESLAAGEVEYEKILNVPRANTSTEGIVKLYSGCDSDSEQLAATPKAVKTAYYKGVEAKTAADNAQHTANSAENIANNANDNANGRVSKRGDTMTGTLTTPNVETGSVNSSAYLNLNSANGTAFYKTGEGNYLALLQNIGLELNVQLKANKNIITKHHGAGGYHNQFDMQAPFFVDAVGYTREYTFHPFVKGKVRTKGDWGASFSMGYTTKQTGYYENGEFGRGVINLNEDNGKFFNWEFEHSGTFRSAGDVVTSTGRSLNSTIYKEGNPHDIALSWLSDGLKVRVDTTDLGRVVFRHDFQYQKIGNFEIRRYPDGTMIQTYYEDFSDVHNQENNSGSEGERSLVWALAFANKPIVFGNITTSINDGHDVGINILSKSSNTHVYWYNYEHGRTNQGACRIQFLAFGRWK